MGAQKEVNLQIQGMTCAACANRIEKGLNKIEGVENANVNFAIEKTKVVYDLIKQMCRILKIKLKN